MTVALSYCQGRTSYSFDKPFAVFRWYFSVLLFSIAISSACAQVQQPDYLAAQRVLKDRGFDIGVVDGRWGQRSIKALRAFQQWEGLTPNGTLDQATVRRLRELGTPEPAKEPTPAPLPIAPQHIESPASPHSRAAPVSSPLGVGLSSTQPQPSTSAPLAVEIAKPIPESRPTWTVFGLLIVIAASLVWGIRRGRVRGQREASPQPNATVAESGADGPSSPDRSSESSLATNTAFELAESQSTSSEEARDPTVAERFKAYETALEVALEAALTYHSSPPSSKIAGDQITIEPIEPLVGNQARVATSQPDGISSLFPSSRLGEWTPLGRTVVIGGRKISKGMIYVGRSLPRRGGGGDENCLINPDLEVAAKSDGFGAHLSYWPAYAQLAPSSRAAYLDWLVGPRADPTIDIGFVFLYFYGLERRLMLDEPGEERSTLIAEVRRLLDTYGGNHSFHRYATTLLAANAARSCDPNITPTIDFFSDSGEPPLALRIALGMRARDGRKIEADLLLAFVMTHPETQVRTPARRALPELRLLFKAAVEKAFPDGPKFSRSGKARRLDALYAGASGTFMSEILPKNHGLPDVMRLSEPLATARRLFEACSIQLDAYSRELGRGDGLKPNLSTLSRLPAELRNIVGETLPDAPLAALAEFAAQNAPIDPESFVKHLGLTKTAPTDTGKLREWARILGAFGYGITSDPLFALRRPTPDAPFVIFALGAPEEGPTPPTEAFRTVQTTVALGVMIALADGVFAPEEHETLARLIEAAPGLEDAERRRLRAEIISQAANPMSLVDLRTRLKRAPAEARNKLGADIIHLAGADGRIEPKEVTFIETLFRQLDLDSSNLYGRLHGTVASREPFQREDVRLAASLSPSGLDPARLAAIRAETAGAASVLSEIFADEEAEAPAPPTAPATPAEPLAGETEGFDGLDGRHRSLLLQLSDRDEWPRSDFDRIARSVELLPGAALDTLNDWALERFDDLLLEGDDPVAVNAHLLSLNVRQVAT